MERTLIIKLFSLGHSRVYIAKQLGVSRRTLYEYLKKHPIREDEIETKNASTPKKTAKSEKILQPKPNTSAQKPLNPPAELPNNLPHNWQELSLEQRRELLHQKMDGHIKKILE